MTEEENKKQKELRRQERKLARRQEWEKIRGLGPAARIRYLWDYYKIVPILVLAAVIVVRILISMVIGAHTTTLLYTCIMNVSSMQGDDEALRDDFGAYIGGVGKWEQIVIDSSIRIDPQSAGLSQSASANLMKLTALTQNGMLDVCLAPEDVTEYLAQEGLLLGLDDLLDEDLKRTCDGEGYLYTGPEVVYDEQSQERILREENPLIYAVRVDPYGVLAGYGIQTGQEVWFSVIASSKRTETAMKLLEYVTGAQGEDG